MILKKNAYTILVFTGYVTVGFAMENKIEDNEINYLIKIGVNPDYIEQVRIKKEKNKTVGEIVNDFETIQYKPDIEFTDINDNKIPLENFSENKPKSLVSTYYNWLIGTKK